MKNGVYLPVLILTLALSGCDKDRDEKESGHEHSAHSSTAEKYGKNAPNVSGQWSGTWESTRNKGHGGGLSCEATEKNKNEWEAVFTAEYGKTSSYNVNLKGRLEEGKVIFGGKVDLGEKGGGVFNWTGRASATEFSGEYEGGGDTGSFKMTRKSDKSGRAAPKRSEDNDAYLSDKAKKPFIE